MQTRVVCILLWRQGNASDSLFFFESTLEVLLTFAIRRLPKPKQTQTYKRTPLSHKPKVSRTYTQQLDSISRQRPSLSFFSNFDRASVSTSNADHCALRLRVYGVLVVVEGLGEVNVAKERTRIVVGECHVIPHL